MKKRNAFVLILFLLGIFMGAIDSGIVSPAREIIENSFGVSRSAGVWVITIYTLFYAVSMPIVSKLADRYGHKKIYVVGIALFGLGSLLCGLSNFYGNFVFVLIARVIQAVGAGGINPIATTVIGQSFPKEKRGTALGLVGAIYGVGTIVGPTLGSAILDAATTKHWGWIFFINVPISIIILLLSVSMKETTEKVNSSLDLLGASVLAVLIGSFMYALTNMDFFSIVASIKSTKVYPYLIVFIIVIPIFIKVEKKAEDPIMNLKYFTNKNMVTIFITALIVGIGMMSMIYIPQFAENTLKLKSGSGGYLITLLAVFSGVAAPVSGKIIDKKGAPFVLSLGFLFTIIGTLTLAFIAAKSLTFLSIFFGLMFMGLGVGFAMGAPLNYLVLQAVPSSEGTTAIAAMSLIRSIGVTISPSLMIGFITDAAKNLEPALQNTLNSSFTKVAPSMKLNFSGNTKMAGVFKKLQNSDVTTIVNDLKSIFKSILPQGVNNYVLKAIEGERLNIENTFQAVLNKGYSHMFTAAAVIAFIGLITSVYLYISMKDEEMVEKL